MIECSIQFLYLEYTNDPDSKRYSWMKDSADFSKLIKESTPLLNEYGFTIQNGIIEKLPDAGISELMNSNIQTDEPERFEIKRNEAVNQFLERNGTTEAKKSACAKLSLIIDYIRPNLKGTELNKDIDELMDVVNNTDIRHSKKTTRILREGNKEDSAFIEWVFYSLLNCINFYLKISEAK